jgi:hypothetical protein
MAADKPPPEATGSGAGKRRTSRRGARPGRRGPGALEQRVAALEAGLAAALDRLGAELRTARLVVIDGSGAERIVGEVVDGTAELRLDLPGTAPPRRTSLLVFASPSGVEPGEAVGLQLWVGGELALDLGISRELGGPWRTVHAAAAAPEPEQRPGSATER